MGSISQLLAEVREGSDQAALQLWAHYWDRLCAVAKRELTGSPTQVADDEDVAITAFHSFVRRLRAGEYLSVKQRDEAWRLLVVIAVHKALNLIRDAKRVKRIPANDGKVHSFEEQEIASSEEPPDVDAMISDSVEFLLSQLETAELRSIAMAKLAGYSNKEIADSNECSLATVERRLKIIRLRWKDEIRYG